MISPDNDLAIWTALLAICFFGIYGERNGWFGKVSGALVVLILGGVFASTGVLPSASNPEIEVQTYDWVFIYFIPLSIPLLLFNVSVKRMLTETGNLLIPFLIGAAGVVIGSIVAFTLLNLGDETYKLSAIFIGTYTGGSVNFMSLATAFDFLKSPLFPSVVAVDNVLTTLYILMLFALPSWTFLASMFPEPTEGMLDQDLDSKELDAGIGLLEQLTTCLLVSGAILVISRLVSPILTGWLHIDIQMEVLLITGIIVILVNIAPKFFSKYEETAYDLGMFLMYIFLTVIGAAADLKELFVATPGILVFATIVLSVHLLVILIASRLFKVSLKEILIASCANAGGPSVAAPMAVSFGMKKLVTPAILISLLGYVIGTFLGLGVGLWLG